MKRSKKLWFLTVFFIWAFCKSAGSIYSYQSVSDYNLLSWLGFSWAFFVINIFLMALELSTAVLLIMRNSLAYLSGVALSVSACINGAIVTAIGAHNTGIIKSMYIASREARGMTVNQEQLGFMFTQQGLFTMLILYIMFYFGLFIVLRKVKSELGAGASA